MGQNKLGTETSPYLLQHKNNPVWWRPWGKESFEAARNEDKPIFLSIGYSTCYWCHVMEHDSFEQQDVADALNENFICIKVDREERPDVDALYMDAVVAISGHGGWPMSVFLTPDLKPFFGGTFYYRNDFLQILKAIDGVWRNERDKVKKSAEELISHINASLPSGQNKSIAADSITKAYEAYARSFDEVDGGFGTAPKFPPSQQVSLLLRIHKKSRDARALHMALFTLEAMARGGLYDQLGGGFHRYSTDGKWIVPHFEKMLYDNALLTFSYLEAFQVSQALIFKEVARETFEYTFRELMSPKGGFYSAQDAGEVEKEGEYYVWQLSELQTALTKTELDLLDSLYSISKGPNFEGKYQIFTFSQPKEWSLKLQEQARKLHERLFNMRSQREKPHRDEKILTAWNGLMLSALAKAYQVLNDGKYLNVARGVAQFLKTHLFRNGELLRSFASSEARHAGCLEDYAYLIEGLLHLYESSGEGEWFLWAQNLQGIQDKLFWDNEGGYFSSNAPELILKKKEYIDGATPSGNSVAALNLLRLHALTGRKEYLDKAQALMSLASTYIERYPAAFPKMLQAVDFENDRSREFVIFEGADGQLSAIRELLFSKFIPNKVVVQVDKGGKSPVPITEKREALNGKTTVYVCEHGTCSLPVHTIEDFSKSLV